jgi:site-specific DNA recombinase
MVYQRSAHVTTEHCIIHCRVSTAKQAIEGESLDIQSAICQRIAETRHWPLAHPPWLEAFTGRAAQRPMFDEILAFLDANPGLVRYYLFRSIDRTTRNGVITYELMKRGLAERGVQMVDSFGIIQPPQNTLAHFGFEYKWSMSSPSKISELVAVATAEGEITTMLTRMIGQEIWLRQNGYKVRPPLDGFVNAKIEVNGKKVTVEKPDPERAPYLISMFELRASGQLTDQEICNRLNAQGYRTQVRRRWDMGHLNILGHAGGKPLTAKRLQTTIRRPIYCGIICEKWTHHKPVKAAYEGLVSIETFNAANRGAIRISEAADGSFNIDYDVTAGQWGQKHVKDSPLFPYRKVVRCSLCSRPFLGSSPRGKSGQRFPTYHCSRKHRYFGVPKALLEGTLETYLDGLKFQPDGLSQLKEIIASLREGQEKMIQQALIAAQKTVRDLETEKSDAVRAFKLATSDTMRRSLEQDVERLEREIVKAGQTPQGRTVTDRDLAHYLIHAQIMMEHPWLMLDSKASPIEIEASYAFVFDDLPTYEQLCDGTPKLAWIFSVVCRSERHKSGQVGPNSLEWNTVERSIVQWKEVSRVLDAFFKRRLGQVPDVPDVFRV